VVLELFHPSLIRRGINPFVTASSPPRRTFQYPPNALKANVLASASYLSHGCMHIIHHFFTPAIPGSSVSHPSISSLTVLLLTHSAAFAEDCVSKLLQTSPKQRLSMAR